MIICVFKRHRLCKVVCIDWCHFVWTMVMHHSSDYATKFTYDVILNIFLLHKNVFVDTPQELWPVQQGLNSQTPVATSSNQYDGFKMKISMHFFRWFNIDNQCSSGNSKFFWIFVFSLIHLHLQIRSKSPLLSKRDQLPSPKPHL